MGKVPSDVQLKNVHLAAVLPNNSVLCNFWMNVENFEVVEENVYHSEDVWFQFMRSVSQAAPARRLNIKKPTKLDWFNGSGSGGYISDSVFEDAIGSIPQQQYYLSNFKLSRNFYWIIWNFRSRGSRNINRQCLFFRMWFGCN